MRTQVVRDLRSGLHLPVIVPAALLLLCGVAILSRIEILIAGTWVDSFHLTQLTGIAVSAALGTVAILIPYKTLLRHAYLGYAGVLGMLVFVLAFGEARNGSHRWVTVGGLDFQPSELMKLVLVVTLARFIRFRSSYKTFRGLWAPFLLTLVPMGLILLQPDLGTALLCVPLLFTMLFVAGARLRHLGLIILLGAAAIYPCYRYGLKEYQQARIRGFLVQVGLQKLDEKNAEMKELNKMELYQLNKASVAIGAGGWAGVGVDEDEAQALFSVPERHNDFVFASVAHAWGWLGCAMVLLVYVWLLLAILAVAQRQRDPAGRLICVGVFALFFFQGFINIAMNVGLMPITGMTLPFLSYGRSSVVVCVLSIALVCNVAARPSYEFGRGDFA